MHFPATDPISGDSSKRTKSAVAIRDCNSRNWSDLPHDILLKIIENYFLSDRLRIAAVCKSWAAAAAVAAPRFEIPWVLQIPNPFSIKSALDLDLAKPLLYEPRNPKPFRLANDLMSKAKLGIHFREARIRASRFGWLLFQDSKLDDDGRLLCNYFFLYSPFACKIITLSDFDSDIEIGAATFSCAPTSPDCFVFLVSESEDRFRPSRRRRGRDQVVISVCRVEENKWNKHVFENSRLGHVVDFLYLDGVLYCLFSNAALAGFTIHSQELIVLTNSLPPGSLKGPTRLMTTSQGQLSLLVISIVGYCPEIFEFDQSRKVWMKHRQVGLEDTIMFFGECGTVSVPAVGAARHMASRIYFGDSVLGMYLYYCLRDSGIYMDSEVYSHVDDDDNGFTTRLWITPEKYTPC